MEKEPGNSSGHNNLGLSYFEMQNFTESANCFTEVARIPAPCVETDEIYGCLGCYQAIKLEKTNASYHNNRGLCFYHLGGSNLPKSLKVEFARVLACANHRPGCCRLTGFRNGNRLGPRGGERCVVVFALDP